jgi:hypothetical protein
MDRSRPQRGPSTRLPALGGSIKASQALLYSWATEAAEAKAEDAAEASDPGEDLGGADSKMFITDSRWQEETGYKMYFFSIV